ncbi:BRCT domain-containing protein [Xanthomonas sp. NCPPB 2632]|uniref:BRCT domain-containing protein n=1 Tax=Xanthomonas sp. NCPPB 2632 TaxID=3240912 RepID=UPI0035180592
MPSEKVTRILRKRGVADADILAMLESQAWDHVYATKPPKREKGLEICFTGFTDSEKSELADLAKRGGLTVVTKVTKACFILCAGATAGAKKMKEATDQGVRIITRAELENFLLTGELLSDPQTSTAIEPVTTY